MSNPRWAGNLVRALVWAAALFLAAALPLSAGKTNERIRFPKGSTSTEIQGAVIRGETDRYLLGARAGQTLTVRITSEEDNAVFQLYRPGGRTALPGAAEEEDATRWNGKLPDSGDYVLVVGGTRGNAGYKLAIKIE
jgi:hypothetical protein